MPKMIEIDEKLHCPALYDSATGQSCTAEKVVDITEDCPKADGERRLFLLFTRVQRGRIVQMVHPYNGQVWLGSSTHFFVDELEAYMHVESRNDTFGSWAERFGLTKQALRSLIEANAPA